MKRSGRSCVPPRVSSCLPIASARMCFAVAAKIALIRAGANGGTPGSPTPLDGVSGPGRHDVDVGDRRPLGRAAPQFALWRGRHADRSGVLDYLRADIPLRGRVHQSHRRRARARRWPSSKNQKEQSTSEDWSCCSFSNCRCCNKTARRALVDGTEHRIKMTPCLEASSSCWSRSPVCSASRRR
jgi:hypothetical protein